MTILSRSTSLLVVRTCLSVAMLSFAVFCAWPGVGLRGDPPAQKKPRTEEEEETPRKQPKRKVIRVEEEEETKSKPGTNKPGGSAANGDLAQLAEQTTHPALKALFRSLAVPYDLVLFKPSSVTIDGERRQREDRPNDRIEPTPLYLGDDPGRFPEERLQFTPLPADGKPQKPYAPSILRIASVRPYEQIAQEKVHSFLRQDYDRRDSSDPLYLSRDEMLKAAEQVLSSVLSWHESAVQTGKRRGKEWDKIERELRRQLLDEVWLEQLKMLARAKDWDKVFALTHRLTVTYTGETERKSILAPVADMIRGVLNDPTSTEKTKQEACKRLHELETKFPDDQLFQPLSNMLRARAEGLLNRARAVSGDKKDPQKLQQARELLQQAEETWPQLEGLREFKRDIGLEYPILRVGMRGPLPKYFSPMWACTDKERCAMEMLFESLVKLVPDKDGGFRYVPGLAESPPQVVLLGRQFELPRNAFWSDGKRLSFDDIYISYRLLCRGVGRSRLWGELLEQPERMRDPFQVTLRLKHGFLDPLAPMTFKILPRDLPVTTEEFAKAPVTSGPFFLGTLQSDERRREYLPFLANPAYGQRPSKRGIPHIQEVRFYSYADNANIGEELLNDKLDLVLDLTAKEAEELKKQDDIVVPMPSRALPNRRIYFLAINTRKLDEVRLRQALSCAIDRELILDKHFRGPLKTLHKALNGPFPTGSWACKQNKDNQGNKSSRNLFDPELAKVLVQNIKFKAGPFKLKYAADNSAVDEAMKELCAQVKERTRVVLEPTPLSPYQLREDVERTKNYDLAYYYYDFPDESYWLGPLLGPPPLLGTQETNDYTNIFKLQIAELSQLLAGTKSYRNFAEVRKFHWATHDRLNSEVPFIPLWQLDPLLAYRRDLEPPALDPLLVFSNIEEWRLHRK